MHTNKSLPEKILRTVVLVTLICMAVWGLVCAIAEVRPFWIDEWRIIYNLKFRTGAEIWGRLAFMQQFPRLYLSLVRLFARHYEYSYQSLRALPFLAGLLAIVAIYSLSAALYGRHNKYRYLLIMMLVSCGTFTQYFVEVKQYTMELLLSVAALWQAQYLLVVGEGRPRVAAYIFLCVTMLAAPFFSYTYPIAIAPAYATVLVQNITGWGENDDTKLKITRILRQWLPLFLCTFSITVFYQLDASRLSGDADMQDYWKHLMPGSRFNLIEFAEHTFHFFAQAGAGFVFWWLFGLSCLAAFCYSMYRCLRNMAIGLHSVQNFVLLYCLLLLLLIMGLNIAGKLPLGEPRLNAFAIPAISFVLIFALQYAEDYTKWPKVPVIVFYVMMAGLTGNIYTTIIASFTDEKYEKRMAIYHATQEALRTATARRLPVLVTPGVAYPYHGTRNYPFIEKVPGDWVLMTWPAYKTDTPLTVYAIADTAILQSYLLQLPEEVTTVMVGDGINYSVIDLPANLSAGR